MLLLLPVCVALADEPIAAARVVSERQYVHVPAAWTLRDPPPIRHEVFDGSSLVVRRGTLFHEWVVQTPGWVVGPDPSIRGLPLGEVPLYVDGMRVGTADALFGERRGR